MRRTEWLISRQELSYALWGNPVVKFLEDVNMDIFFEMKFTYAVSLIEADFFLENLIIMPD